MKKQLDEIVDTKEEIRKIVNQMTNWQRNQWNRAGRPNDIETVLKFKELKRDS